LAFYYCGATIYILAEYRETQGGQAVVAGDKVNEQDQDNVQNLSHFQD
jgi:hypothetical protein